MSVGFAGGGGDLVKQRDGCVGGSGAGIKIDPIGFLVVKDGVVRMLNIQPPAITTLDRVIDLVPQLLDRAEAFIDRRTRPRPAPPRTVPPSRHKGRKSANNSTTH